MPEKQHPGSAEIKAVEERRALWADRFDSGWYAARNPDVAQSGIEPFVHFILYGLDEGRAPTPDTESTAFWRSCFDTAWYLDRYLDVRRNGIDPFEHFLRYGMPERRRPGPRWSWDTGMAVRDLQAVVLLRSSPLFDAAWYLAKYPDVAGAGIDPVHHYLIRGALAGYDPGPHFNSSDYLSRNPDVTATTHDGNPLLHYIRHRQP